MSQRRLSRQIALLLVVIFLTGCTSPASTPSVNGSKSIDQGSSFGQTFTAQNKGLSGISVSIAPAGSTSTGNLVFHLRTSSQSGDDLARAVLPISEINPESYTRFDFAPQPDSARKDYYLQVDVEGAGQVQIRTADADSYIDGALYINQAPQEAQLAFTLDYNHVMYLLGLVELAVKWAGILLVGAFIFILPGWACLSYFLRGWKDLSWISRLGLSAGLSLAIYPLLLLWTDLIGLHFGMVYAWAPPVIAFVALAWKNHSRILPWIKDIRHLPQKIHFAPLEILLSDIAFVILLGIIILSRMWVTRGLDVPLYGDSYQHTMITQLIIDHGGLFSSWEPYTDLVTFTYHFGFHSDAAVFHWITGASAPRAVLWTGQLINILAILSLYPLGMKIAKTRWAGVIAMLVGGMLSSMPMTYINWGRYTQLAGQAILPVVIWLGWTVLERSVPPSSSSWLRKLLSWPQLDLDSNSLVLISILLGGLALTHYRILIFGILFFPAFIILFTTRKIFFALVGRTLWMGMGGALLFLPWLVHLLRSRMLGIFTSLVTTPPSKAISLSDQLRALSNLQNYLPIYIWVLILACLLLGLWKRKKDLLVITLWWLLIFLAANTQWIGLPGADVVTTFAVYIALYIPAGLIIGSMMEWITRTDNNPGQDSSPDKKSGTRKTLVSALALIVVAVSGLWLYPARINDLQIPTYALMTRPDLRAMAWIKENTPGEAVFLVNSFFAYNDTLVAGSDGGWWLPLLAGRKTSLPPLTYSFEEGSVPTNISDTNDLSYQIKAKGITSSEIIPLLRQHGISYIYIGQRQGVVNYRGPKMLDPQVIASDTDFTTVYHQDSVWVFKVKQ